MAETYKSERLSSTSAGFTSASLIGSVISRVVSRCLVIGTPDTATKPRLSAHE